MRLVGALMLGALLVGPPTEAAPPVDRDEAELRRLTEEVMGAVQRKDRPRLEATLAPGFMLTAPGAAPGEGVPRAEWLDNAVGRDWSDFHYRNVAVEVFGERAMVTSNLQFRVSPMPFTLDSDIVDVWHRNGGRWQLHRRYLGQSSRDRQLTFAAGVLTGLVALGILLGLRRLLRRRRRA